MKKIIILSVMILLSGCSNDDPKKVNEIHVRCIGGLEFLVYHGGWGTTFEQIYAPAENPANRPQPKTCVVKK